MPAKQLGMSHLKNGPNADKFLNSGEISTASAVANKQLQRMRYEKYYFEIE
jgi:hypothetical protein